MLTYTKVKFSNNWTGFVQCPDGYLDWSIVTIKNRDGATVSKVKYRAQHAANLIRQWQSNGATIETGLTFEDCFGPAFKVIS